MTKELLWLTLTAILTGVLWVPYILDRIMVRGLMGAMANPSAPVLWLNHDVVARQINSAG